jgi:RNA polymerase sigma factor (TIGR02999 family)
MPSDGPITRAFAEPDLGGREGLDRLFPLLYDELYRLASAQLRSERADHTLGATGLIHEAYVKLSGLDRIEWKNRSQFMAVAAQAMRRVLVNHANARRAQKRGGPNEPAPLDEVVVVCHDRSQEVLELDHALTRLAALDERQARVVECRFFAGMTVDETAEALAVAPATVKRDWTVARAWLHRELGSER